MGKKYLYVKCSFLLVIILITIIVRILLLSYFSHLKEVLLISTILGSVVVPVLTEAVIFLACGNLITTAISLCFNIKTMNMNSKILVVTGTLLLFPVLAVTIEYFIWILKQGSIPFIITIALHPWIEILLFQCFPAISGIFLFIGNNHNRFKHD